MTRTAAVAHRLWALAEPLHAVTYFSAEPKMALSDAGYKGFWMGYFAGRGAPLGDVGPEVVYSTFFNFSMEHVARAIPDAWSFAPPSAALAARVLGSRQTLERAFSGRGLDDGVARAGALARRAAQAAPMEGRALFAANRALPWPEDPVSALWHACTLLREHRGDGHVAALTSAGISGREANLLQAAAGVVTREVFEVARHYDDAEWTAVSNGLVERGLLDPGGQLSERGAELRAAVEEQTDLLALSAYDCLDDEELEQLVAELAPLARAVIDTGDIPRITPIGGRFDLDT